MKIAFAPICACKNNRRIWRHNASISRSRDVTDQLWWRHNAKSEKTVPDDNCDMSDRWLFLEKMCVKDIKLRVRNKIIHSLPWITIFGSLVMRFTNDFHSWLRHSRKSLANRLNRDPKIVIHGNSCIILYIWHIVYITKACDISFDILGQWHWILDNDVTAYGYIWGHSWQTESFGIENNGD